MLRACGLRKDYGKDAGLVRAVDGVDLTSPPGETVPSWARAAAASRRCCTCSAGSTAPGGEIWLAGRRVDQLGERALARLRRDALGFVFQAFHLMDELTAVENVELPALLAGRSPRAARRRAAGLLERVGLADRARLPARGAVRRPAPAGGHRPGAGQRPAVVLADEPTGNLDSEATLDVLRLFDSLHAAGQTLVIVTHDARIAATADRLISMRDGAFVDQTRVTGGTTGSIGALAGLEG